LVTPSTIIATSGPSSRSMSSLVEERRRDRDVVETEVGEHQRDPDRVRDVGLARAAHLLAVGVARDLVGVLDHRSVAAPVPLEVAVDERSELGVDGVRTPPGQDGAPVGADLDARLRGAHLLHNPTGAAGVPPRSWCEVWSATLLAALLAPAGVGGAATRGAGAVRRGR
jgi:hypothetical protein